MTHLCCQWQALVGWVSSLSVMVALVGLAYSLREVPPGPSLPHAVYQGLHRTLWALAVAWIILACEEGYGGRRAVRAEETGVVGLCEL